MVNEKFFSKEVTYIEAYYNDIDCGERVTLQEKLIAELIIEIRELQKCVTNNSIDIKGAIGNLSGR